MSDFRNRVYNQEIKERFLNSIELDQYPPRWWERIFEKSYLLESMYDKDLYSFTTPDIITFYKYLDVAALASLSVCNLNLIKYAQWAMNEFLISDGQNHFDEMDNALLATCINTRKINQSIFSYDKFIETLKKFYNAQDKYIFFCLFEGIKGKNYEDIANLTMQDIDEKNLLVHLSSGRDVYVSQEFIDICKEADKETVYYALKNETKKKLVPSVTIYKEKGNMSIGNTGRNIFRVIERSVTYIDGIDGKISGKSIRDSGLIYYLNRRADKLGIGVEELLSNPENCQDIIDKYQFNLKVKKSWMLQYKDLLH